MIQSFLVLSGDPDPGGGGEPSVLSSDPDPGGGGEPSVLSGDPHPGGCTEPSVLSGDPDPGGGGKPSGQVCCAFPDSVPLPGALRPTAPRVPLSLQALAGGLAPMSGTPCQSVELAPRDRLSSPPSSELPQDTSNSPLRFQPLGSTFKPIPVQLPGPGCAQAPCREEIRGRGAPRAGLGFHPIS